MTEADKIANVQNWDNSRIEEDYFDVNYYLNLYIGKWDKPFQEVHPKKYEPAGKGV